MSAFKKMLVFLLLVITLFQTISSECRQSYITLCDNFTDFKNYKFVETVSEVMIGSEDGPANTTSIHLMNTLRINKYYKLTNLMVVRVINKLETTYGYQCTYYNTPLKYLILYGNELKTLEAYQFPLVPLKKLSLVNNKIEIMKSWAFRYYAIENIDLSDNSLEVIESGALPTNVTKIITIRNNKLNHIEPESFPLGLEYLNLDKNKLRYIQNEVLENLVNLKELTLSYNDFTVLPKITQLQNLVIFDIAHNKITTIKEGTFSNMEHLKMLDLTGNSIDSPLILEWITTPKKQPEMKISLALNHLRNLNIGNVSLQNQEFLLYGNPWDCDIWADLTKNFEGHESDCDKTFISSGKVPYCINYRSGSYPFVSLWEKDIDKLHDIVKKSEQKSECQLALERYHNLYPPSFGCVA